MLFTRRNIRQFAIPALIALLVLAIAIALDYPCAFSSEPPLLVSDSQSTARQGVFVACGEYARKASNRMTSIVSSIDEIWDTRVRVNESVAPSPPHARPGGCIFYNAAFMGVLMRGLMVQDSSVANAMLYAIMAHEIGHEMHNDFSEQRADVAPETKELQADRFAGYTLERLNISLDNVTPYYSLVGDEFTGSLNHAADRHGVSMQRTEALKKAWERAEWNQPEDYKALSEDE
jgi:hypothetical protein